MKNKSTKQLILSGLFIAIGIVLPIIFHSIGGGSMFLPMHIPVLIAGFFLSIPYALSVGALTTLLSSLLTGMPPVFPVLPFMIVELATYGVIVSLLYRKYNMNVYVSLIISMICGRIMAGLVVWSLATFFMAKLPSPMIFITASVTKSIPGIVIQLIFIPVIVMAVNKNRRKI
ncbi:ECF transporter S component [Clostridium sp.]|uniref:ECF transporter S component n=1 Tax=Clostridium sp. TaxID=1506 RepID=UPI003D6CFF79